MSYIVTVRGGEAFTLDDADGFDLRCRWLDAKQPFPVELGDATVISSQIVKIVRRQMTEADVPRTPEQMRLEAGKCKGQFSIALEINKLAKAEGGKKWAKLVSDPAWRERKRKELHATGQAWCDSKTGECACQPSYVAVAGRHNV